MVSEPAIARSSPAAQRNRDPILEVLQRVLPAEGTVLEVASGTGEHAAYFAPRLAPRVWLPSDPDPANRASIAAWRQRTQTGTILPPIDLDACTAPWPVEETPPSPPVTAIVAINLIHIAPWRACLGLMAGAGRILPAGGVLYLYGAYKMDGAHTADSNEAFDQSLKARNPEWGVRDLADVTAAAAAEGLVFAETVAMPANNFSVIFRRPSA